MSGVARLVRHPRRSTSRRRRRGGRCQRFPGSDDPIPGSAARSLLSPCAKLCAQPPSPRPGGPAAVPPSSARRARCGPARRAGRSPASGPADHGTAHRIRRSSTRLSSVATIVADRGAQRPRTPQRPKRCGDRVDEDRDDRDAPRRHRTGSAAAGRCRGRRPCSPRWRRRRPRPAPPPRSRWRCPPGTSSGPACVP